MEAGPCGPGDHGGDSPRSREDSSGSGHMGGRRRPRVRREGKREEHGNRGEDWWHLPDEGHQMREGKASKVLAQDLAGARWKAVE